MNDEEFNKASVSKADNEIGYIIKNAERKLEDIDHRNEQRIREVIIKIENRAEKDLEKARKTIILMASAMIVLIVSGLILFINYEAKSVYDSIGELKEQMQIAENEVDEARKSLGQQVSDFRSVSEGLSYDINQAIEENRNAVVGIQTTQSEFETRLSEVTDEARESMSQQVANLQRTSERFSQQVDAAIRENQNAVAGLMTTKSQFEDRLSEVSEAKVQYQTMSSNIENMMELSNQQHWEEFLIEEAQDE